MTSSAIEPNSRGVLATLARAAIAVAGAALIGMVVVEGWQVFTRYVLNDSPGWTEPLALLLLNTAMSFGAAVGVRNHSHFGFFIAVQSAPPTLRRVLQSFSCLVVAAIGAVLAWWGAMLFVDGLGVPLAGTLLPQSAVFLPMATGGGLIALFSLERLRGLYAAPTQAS
jgi:TRAP-type C4-dicarboxylate transport system permease small subunit